MPTSRPALRYWLTMGVLGLLVLSCGVVPLQTIWDDGMRDMDFHFHVSEARTKQPLPGVRIALYDDLTAKTQELRTDDNGDAMIALSCMTSCTPRFGILWGTTRRSIYYPNRVVLAWKRGFKQLGPLYLEGLVGRWHVGEYAPPPPVHLEMVPE
jgi:hypothetical protein